MGNSRHLRTSTPDGSITWECTLSVPPDNIPHYSHNAHLPVFFYGGWASSFAPFAFRASMMTDDMEAGPTSLLWEDRERWFQAHKTTDPQVIDAIRTASDTWTAKTLGNSRSLFTIVEGWDDGLSYEVMLEGIRIQLDRYERLREALLETGQRFIAEVSPTDTIWGIYNKEADSWDGKNWLGAAWMQARNEL